MNGYKNGLPTEWNIIQPYAGNEILPCDTTLSDFMYMKCLEQANPQGQRGLPAAGRGWRLAANRCTASLRGDEMFSLIVVVAAQL